MKLSTYRTADLREADGMDLASVGLGPTARLGAGVVWGRVAPGTSSLPNQHDEVETWVVVAGTGEVVVDAVRHPVAPASIVQFEPFETHFVENTGPEDLVFASFYWRDSAGVRQALDGSGHRRFAGRPVFVFSSAPTPNGDLHLGHLSGPFFGADVFVRFQRMTGVEAWHVTGSDDFQSYVVAAARQEGREPAETAAHYSREILATLEAMDIEVHQYTATSRDPGYPAALQGFFSRLAASPAVHAVEGTALFDGDDGHYLYEVDVAGGCPTCGSRTNGNICEACREPNCCTDLVEPRASGSDTAPRPGPITRYTVSLRDLATDVEAHHRLGRVPAGAKELADRVFRRERLDIAITHPAGWGIPPVESEVDGQVIWVWLDLAFNFLHSVEELGRRLDRDWRADAPQADWKIVHFLGSDGTFYHPLLFPALYRLAYPGWQPDIDYNINEFYELDGSKFSTSRRHAIWGRDILTPRTVDGIRLYLAHTRPEGRRTNFELAAYESFVRDTLVGGWQEWLGDLGRRIAARHDGLAPDAGIWTPEHTAFLARLERHRSDLAGSLGPDDFSLNRAAGTLLAIVADAAGFARQQAPLAGIDRLRDEARTATALELAAARLLSAGSAPVMPRFATALAAALGDPPPQQWPDAVTLVAPGTTVDLTDREFFGLPEEPSPFLPAVTDLVRAALRLPAHQPVRGRSLVALGLQSLQAIGLQYEIAEKLGADVSVGDLLAADVAGLAGLVERELAPPAAAEQLETVQA